MWIGWILHGIAIAVAENGGNPGTLVAVLVLALLHIPLYIYR